MTKSDSMADVQARYLLYWPVFGILCLAAMYATVYQLTKTSFAEREFEALGSQLDTAEDRLSGVLDEKVADIQAEAAKSELIGKNVEELERFTKAVPWAKSAAVYDTFGSVRVSTSVYMVSKQEVRDAMHAALAGRTALSKPFPKGGAWDSQEIAIFVPLEDEVGQPAEVLAVCASLESVWNVFGRDPPPDRARIALLDAYGQLLMPDGTGAEPQRLKDLGVAASPQSPHGRQPGYMYLVREIHPSATASGPTWTLLALKPWEEVQAAVLRTATVNGFAAALTLGMVGLIGFGFKRRVIVPLSQAASAAAKLSKGQLGVNLPEKGPAELRAIADAVNHMISELKYHRQTMSFMVESRTKKIDAARKALEESTAQLRASYDSAQEAVLIMDVESGEILQANRRLQQMFDLSEIDVNSLKTDDLFGRFREMFREPADFVKRWQYYAENPDAEGTEEWELVRPHRMTLSVYTAPVRSENRTTVFSRLWTFRDVSEQRERDERLRHAQKLEAMSHLSGSLAHDFNNLLTVILGNLSIARMELEGNSDVIAHLDAAEEATNDATNLARQLLGFSDRGGRLQLRPINLNEVIQQVSEVMKESADPRVEISCSICASLWDVPADTGQIRQVIINLCMNAIDSLPNGGHVMLKTENVTVGRSQHGIPPDREPGHYVSITVEDDGIGMDPSVRERIFEPFFTTKSKAGSQGLGLAMAYGSVTKHGGWITCESEPDQGSRFSIYLLRTEQRSEPMIVEHQTAEGRNTEPCILVVDDEAGVRRIAVSVLKRSSFKTMEACDGDEAIKIFREQGASIDAVLLDLSMPKVSGRETFIALKKMNQNIPVLLCSGYPVGLDEFEEETGHRAEAVIQKPFNVAELGKTVHGVLHRSLADAVA